MRYLLATPPGLEAIALREVTGLRPDLEATIEAPGVLVVSPAPERQADPRPLLDLHGADDLLAEVFREAYRCQGDTLSLLANRAATAAVEEAVAARWAVRSAQRALGPGRTWASLARWAAAWPPALPSRDVPRRPAFRVSARLAGRLPYQRAEVVRVVQESLGRRFPSWLYRPEGAAPDLEFVVWASAGSCRLGLRLVESSFARRPWKVGHIAASLPPSIAHALVRLAGVEAGEIVLDPFCGAGTILVERGLASPSPSRLLGGDTGPAARAAARANGSGARVRLEIADWDARSLPLDARGVDAIITNPPYGRQHGDAAQLPALYSAFLREARRVLRPHGRLVVLTSRTDLLSDPEAASAGFVARETLEVDVLGVAARAYRLELA